MDDEITWAPDGAPRSARAGDIYFSPVDGRAESVHVFLNGTDFPGAWPTRCVVAELGFGFGLNFLTALTAWRAARPHARLEYVGFERAPPDADEIRRALAPWCDLDDAREALLADWPPPTGWSTRRLPSAELTLAIGDAPSLLETWTGSADVWFLDGFAPAKNPEMWSEAVLRAVGRRSAPGARLATFTAAGAVRRGLATAGFDVERRAGFGRKRHMTAARRSITPP